jgi:3-dehydroquinate dehydratase/shikimate dehydrogenase
MDFRTLLPKVCIALGFPTVDKLLDQARREVQGGECFLEFRLDYLPDPYQGVEAIRTFLHDFPEGIVLATCRRHQNHGHYNGSIEQQLQILQAAVDAGAQAVDLEIESAESVSAKLDALRSRTYFIVSYHNWESTPAVENVLKRLNKVTAHAYKLVTTARKPSDMLRVLNASKTQPRTSLILLAMGEIGFPTRILAPAFGSLYTYAAPMLAEGTASGQVGAKILRNLYRVSKFTKQAKIYGVIADPVRHSISPAVHNRCFQSKRLDSVYLPFLVHPPQLKDFMSVAEKLPLAGFSVTIPHKQRIIRFVDVVEPLARRIGAVNTVWRKAGKWRGTNTDVAGVVGPLSKKLKLRGASVLVVGNGGAARSAAFALSDAGSQVTIVGRNGDRVRALARVTGAASTTFEQLTGNKYDALVHATPIGMHPNIDESVFPDRIPAGIVFDMVYNPLETRLIRSAREQGLVTIPGLEMFLEQAAAQFEIWTGESAPRSVLEKAALEALGHPVG